MLRKNITYIFLCLLVSCKEQTNNSFKDYLNNMTSAGMVDGLYIILNLNSCSSCNEGLIQVLINNTREKENVTIILMGDTAGLTYYSEVIFANYKTIKDPEKKIVNIFPSSLRSSYVVNIVKNQVKNHSVLKPHIYEDSALIDYFLD